MRQLRAVASVARHDLRRRIRNRSFVIQTVLGPILLATIISLAFGSAWSVDATIGVVDEDGSEVGAGVIDGLTALSVDGLRFERAESVDGLTVGSGDESVDAALVLHEGFAASLAGPEPLPVEVITTHDAPLAGEVAQAVARGLAARVDAGRLAATASLAAGAPLPDQADLAGIDIPIDLTTTDPGDASFPGAFFGPAMGLLFLYLAVATMARELLGEQRLGVLDRIRAAPVHDAAILAGKGLSVVLIGAVTLAVVWAATTVMLGANWGDPLGVALIILGVSLTVAALSGLVAAVAKTEQSADTIASFIAFAMGLIGGNFTGPGSLPESLERLSLLTPNGWAMEAFTDLSAGAASASGVLLHALVLTGMAAAIALAAAALLPRRIGAHR